MMDLCMDSPIILNFDPLLSKLFIYNRGLAVNTIYDFYRASCMYSMQTAILFYHFCPSVRPSVHPFSVGIIPERMYITFDIPVGFDLFLPFTENTHDP